MFSKPNEVQIVNPIKIVYKSPANPSGGKLRGLACLDYILEESPNSQDSAQNMPPRDSLHTQCIVW